MTFKSTSPEDTVLAGESLGKLLAPGDTVALFGELGAGKTVFVKGLARALDISEREITSASFTIISEHEGTHPLYHVDLYRLDIEADIEATGLYEYMGSDGITVIEWAEKLSDTDGFIKVDITIVSDVERDIEITGLRERGKDG